MEHLCLSPLSRMIHNVKQIFSADGKICSGTVHGFYLLKKNKNLLHLKRSGVSVCAHTRTGMCIKELLWKPVATAMQY